MAMHISALVEGEVRQLGYWEGDPPAVGDTIDIDGAPAEVVARHWVDWLHVRLSTVRRRTASMWPYGELWEQR